MKVRSPGMEGLAHRQFEWYLAAVVDCLEKVSAETGETFSVPFGEAARLLLAGMDGLTVQMLSHRDVARSREDVARLLDMVIA